MGDQPDPALPEPKEELRLGPARAPWSDRIPPRWRPWVVALVAFALGGAMGGAIGGGMLRWAPGGPASSPGAEEPSAGLGRIDEHAVEFMLLDPLPPRRRQEGTKQPRSVRVDSALLLSGTVASTVLRVNGPGHGLDVRAPALPLSLSPTARFRSVVLRIVVRDCRAATRWRPAERPFTISWRDEDGKEHLDRGGDFDPSTARSLTRSIRRACEDRPRS